MLKSKRSLLLTFLAALAALGTTVQPSRAHTVAIGYVVTSPGNIDVWFGSYHNYFEAPMLEGHALLTLPDHTSLSDAFTLTSQVTPAGLTVGVNLDIAPFQPFTHAPLTLIDILSWEGAPFTNLTEVGTYTIDLDSNPAFAPTSTKWDNDLGGPISFTINPTTNSMAVPTGGLTPNQQGIVGAVNTGIANGGGMLGPVPIALMQAAAAGTGALGAALNQLSPIAFGNFTTVTAFNNESFETAAMDMYLENKREGAHGTFVGGNGQLDSSGLTVNDANIDPSLQMIHSRLLAWNTPSGISDIGSAVLGGVDMKDAKLMCNCAPPADPWNVFIRGNVVLAQGYSQADQPHFDDNTASVVIGADYRISPNFIAGLTAGYAHTDATLDPINSSATVDSYTPGIYAAYAKDGWFANFLGRYSYNTYTESRNIAFLGQTANGATDGNEGVVDLDGGYDFHAGALTYGPVAGVQYTHLTVNSYSESGSDANLAVREDQADSLRSRLGVSLKYDFRHCGVTFSPHLQATWQHEFMDQARGLTGQFTGFNGGSFVVRTQGTSEDFALIDAGLDAQVNNRVTVFGDYMVQAGQDNYFGQSVQAGVKLGF